MNRLGCFPDEADFVTAKACPLFVHQVVALRQEVSNQTTFDERQTFLKALSWPSEDASREEDALPRLRILKVLHQSQVIQLPLHVTTDTASLPDIQRLEVTCKATTEVVPEIWTAG